MDQELNLRIKRKTWKKWLPGFENKGFKTYTPLRLNQEEIESIER